MKRNNLVFGQQGPKDLCEDRKKNKIIFPIKNDVAAFEYEWDFLFFWSGIFPQKGVFQTVFIAKW